MGRKIKKPPQLGKFQNNPVRFSDRCFAKVGCIPAQTAWKPRTVLSVLAHGADDAQRVSHP